jgi:hypothetical protein
MTKTKSPEAALLALMRADKAVLSTGPFADPRQLYLTIGLCLHELESAQWLSVRLLTPGNMP